MTELAPCHVCGTPTDDACVRCERPACGEHFLDQEHLAICRPCGDELEELIADSPRGLTHWPWPVRDPLPGMYDPAEGPPER